MAIRTNGSSDALYSTAALNLTGAGSGPISIGFWLYWDAFANDDDLALETSVNYNSNAGSLIIDPNSSTTDDVLFGTSSGVGTYVVVGCPRPSAAVWHHYLLVVATDSTSNCAAYVDGQAQSLTSHVNSGAAAWGSHTLYLMSRAALSLFGAGRMADLAFWTTRLVGGHAAALARGARPWQLSPAPIAYWPLAMEAPLLSVNAPPLGTVGHQPDVDPPLVRPRRFRRLWLDSIAAAGYTPDAAALTIAGQTASLNYQINMPDEL